REGCPATGLRREGERVVGVDTAGGFVPAGHVVLAAGAWSGLLAARFGLPWRLPVHPVRGQIVSLRAEAGAPRRILFTDGAYLAPKPDGTVVVGATEDDAGFDRRVTAAAVARILANGLRLAPGLAAASFARAWAGLRPASGDGLPAVGPAPGVEGLTLAVGHFRNGILLGPHTGAAVARALAGGGWDPLLAPFDPARFAV
ncbi:MAG: FAD-dependent oxidoreductase, partial [Clostridia bacterium]|nr:FAD-dependent oxidoreductase [Clostridia bacterium]